MTNDVDLAVVGLGSMGSMALWQAASAGASVLGLEQFGRVHAAGSYTGESRLFRVAAKEGLLFTPALKKARTMWQELEGIAGRDLLLPVGALHVAPHDHPDLQAALAAAREFDLPHQSLSADDLTARYPQFAVQAHEVGLLDEWGGGLRPEAAVLSAQEAALAAGAQIVSDSPVSRLEVDDGGVTLVTADGRIRAGKVIVAGGAWTTRLLPELADIVSVATFALTWMMPRHPERFAGGRMPGFMRDLGDVHAFGVPTLDGFSIKICPHLTLDEVPDVADRPTELTREQLHWVGVEAQRMIPDLVPEPVRWSLHPDSITASHRPVLDTLADGRIAVATGMSGNGFKFAPVYGQALAQLALDGDSPWRHEEFRMANHRR